MTEQQEKEMFRLLTTAVGGIQRLESDIVEIKSDLTQLKSDVAELKSNTVEVKTELIELRSEFHEFREETRQNFVKVNDALDFNNRKTNNLNREIFETK